MVFWEDFNGTKLSSSWGPYGGDPGGWWDPSHVVVTGGMLELQTYKDSNHNNTYVSGGVSSAFGLKVPFDV